MPFGGSSISPLDTNTDKLYEMRMYKIRPGNLNKYLQSTSENIATRLKYSTLIGYWQTEFGTLNRVIHLYQYDSYGQRAKARESMANDSTWQKYLSVASPLLEKQKNIALRRLCDDVKINLPSPGPNCHYRLNVFVLKEPYETNALKFKEISDKIFKELEKDKIDGLQHVATFVSDSTKMNQVIQYVRCLNLDDVSIHKKFCENKELQNLRSEMEKIAILGNSQILKPTPWSPLQ